MPRPAPIRVRRALAGALLLLVVGATGCNAGRPPAATVGDTDIEAATIDEILEALVAASPDTYGEAVAGEGAGTTSMPAATEVLNILVLQTRQAELAAELGVEPTDENRTEADETVRAEILPTLPLPQEEGGADLILAELSDETIEMLVELRAATLALADQAAQEVSVEDAPEAEALLCLRAIAVTPDVVPQVDERLDGGEDFGSVASDVTISGLPDLASQGGELGDCLGPAALVENGLSVEVVTLILDLDEGEYIGPVDLGDGGAYYFEVQARQLDPETALQVLLADAEEAVEVRVDPRFGAWNDEAARILPPEGARDPGAVDPVVTGG